MAGVKLLWFWASPFGYRVIWTLELKGINYEYIEEYLGNKSQLLLHHNPVHKKILMLLHGDKAVAESLVILEYIKETWPENPLLPIGAYERAVGFGSILENQSATFFQLFKSATREEQEKAIKEIVEILKIIEEQGLGDKKFFGGEAIRLVDIAFGWLAYWLEGIEEAVGTKLLNSTTFPRFHSWIQNFKQVPVIKENLLDRQKLWAHC
ncbi:hypothetical protein PVL29_006298 [Vitis rotundifolia]|uniref:Glutathione S-transferase n=1 Tax=Vitis rotundifolia TaxID=103349 RepID=A0AA39A5Q3_VITRO|nr:hypothetical protein PVL29_006298 [Vitis rotundifolia]